MPACDQLEFQRQVIEQMHVNRRRPFRRGVAIDIALSTTAMTPAHIHNVAKNVLDLLSAPLRTVQKRVGMWRRGLLYYDDAQVEALSVSSIRTNGEPRIDITAVSLHDFLEDLGLAARAQRQYHDWDETHASDQVLERWLDWRNSCVQKSPIADDIGASLQADAQREWLEPNRRYLWSLAELFSAPTMPMWAWPVKAIWAERDRDGSIQKAADLHFQDPMLRVLLAEPPHRSGMSAHFRAQVRE